MLFTWLSFLSDSNPNLIGSKLWEGGCAECGDNLVSRGKIKSGYKCKSAGAGGMYLEYDPMEQYEIKKYVDQI
jgi:ribosomal protein L37AE/L43A